MNDTATIITDCNDIVKGEVGATILPHIVRINGSPLMAFKSDTGEITLKVKEWKND